MPSLIVSLSPAPGAAGTEHGWVRVGDDGVTLLGHGSAPLALLPSADSLVLLVPAAALSWHRVPLPPGSLGQSARVRSLLEGLLEDRLLDAPEALHFALEPGARPGAPVWVAACRRDDLHAAVQALEAVGRRVTRIAPEFTPLPEEAPLRVTAIGEPQAAQMVACDAGGVAVLPLSHAGLALAGDRPLDTAVLSAEPAVAAEAEALFGLRVSLMQTAERWMRAAQDPWDLAQFEFATTGRARAGKQLAALMRTVRHAPQWRAARWGALVLVLAQLVGLNAWAWKERRALDAKREALRGMLTQTFPSVRLVVDAPAQMQRQVAQLQQATGGVSPGDLEPMLGVLAPQLPAGRVPAAIDYSDGQLRLRGLGLAAGDVRSLTQALAPRGYSARSEGDLLLMQAEAAR